MNNISTALSVSNYKKEANIDTSRLSLPRVKLTNNREINGDTRDKFLISYIEDVMENGEYKKYSGMIVKYEGEDVDNLGMKAKGKEAYRQVNELDKDERYEESLEILKANKEEIGSIGIDVDEKIEDHIELITLDKVARVVNWQAEGKRKLEEIDKYLKAGDYINAIRYTAVHGEELERLGLDKDKIIENIKRAEWGSEKKAPIDKYLKAGDYANAIRYTAVHGEELEGLGLDKDKIIKNIKGAEKKAPIDKYSKEGDFASAIRYIEVHKDELADSGMRSVDLDRILSDLSKANAAKKIYEEAIKLAKAGKKSNAIALVENNIETMKILIKDVPGLIAQIKKNRGWRNYSRYLFENTIGLIQDETTVSIIASSISDKIKPEKEFSEEEYVEAMRWVNENESLLEARGSRTGKYSVLKLRGSLISTKIIYLKKEKRLEEAVFLLKGNKSLLESYGIRDVDNKIGAIITDRAIEAARNYDERGYEEVMRLINKNEDVLRGRELDADMLRGMMIIIKAEYLVKNGREAEGRKLYQDNRYLIERAQQKAEEFQKR